MGFGFKIDGQTKEGLLRETWMTKTCSACPLLPKTGTAPALVSPNKLDILIVNSPESHQITSHVSPYSYKQINSVECLPGNAGFANETSRLCCFGRKLEVLKRTKPRVVICVGYAAYAEFETHAGFECDVAAQYTPMPTRIDGHEFWLIQLPEFGVGSNYNVTRFKTALDRAMTSNPKVLDGTFKGIEFATTPALIKAAFKDLRTMPYVSADYETNGFRPYFANKKVLSMALGNQERVYAIPLMHPQTSVSINLAETLEQYDELTKHAQMIAHNAAFEQEWSVAMMGIKFLLNTLWHDTMAQAYVLRTGTTSLELKACIRRAFGYDVKAMSHIDVTDLENTPLEQVLSYNGLDTKDTAHLFEHQKLLIDAEKLQPIYDKRRRNIRANIPLQWRGLDLDYDFIKEQKEKLVNLADEYQAEFHEIPEVRQYEVKHGRLKVSARLDKLFHNFLGVSKEITSFDDEFLKNFKHPISNVLMNYRGESKLLSTYIEPLILDGRAAVPWKHKKTTCKIMEDGLIHTSFNALRTVTGRLGSSNPNVQNFPSRGGKKYLRNVVKAPPGYIMVAMDYAQIEARIIASLAQDQAFMNAIWDDYDTHMYWTKKLMATFPGYFVNELDVDNLIKLTKALRGEMKNNWTFPLLYNSAYKSVYDSLCLLTLPGSDLLPEKRTFSLIDEFWEHYPQIKGWQNGLLEQMDRFGQIVTPWGQVMRDLQKTQVTNYTSQSAASDITTEAQSKIIELGIKMGGGKFFVVLNIHDDLTMIVKEECLNEVLAEVIPIMIDIELIKHWYMVPLETEVSTGYSWGNLKEFGKFSSKDYGHVRTA